MDMDDTYTIEYVLENETITETWRQTNLYCCPFCGTEDSVFEQIDGDRQKDGVNCFLCISCRSSFHLVIHKVVSQPPPYSVFIERDIAKLIAAKLHNDYNARLWK